MIDFEAMDNRHETNLNPPVNLICNLCGKIQDFEEGTTLYTERVSKKAGFEVRDYRMEYYGICAECRTQRRREARLKPNISGR